MNNNRTTKPLTFNVDCNPITSKALLGIITHMPVPEIVHMCIAEILSGIQLNSLDLPFYAAACDVVKSALMQKFSDSDKELYDNIIKNARTIVVDAEMLKNQMEHSNEGNNPVQNKSSTESTQDASENTTETYEGHAVNPDMFLKMLREVFGVKDDDNKQEEGDDDVKNVND